MSLQLRLTLCLVLGLSLSMILVFWLTRERVGQNMIEQRVRDVAELMETEEDRLEERLKAHLDTRMRTVVFARQLMQHIARDAERTVVQGKNLSGHGATMERDYSTLAPRVRVLQVPASDLLAGKYATLGLHRNMHSVDGRSLGDVLATLPPQGTFFATAAGTSGQGSALEQPKEWLMLLVRPLPLSRTDMLSVLAPPQGPGRDSALVTVVVLPMTALQEQAQRFQENTLLESYDRAFASTDEGIQTVILNKSGEVLVSTSADPVPIPDSLAEQVLRGNKPYATAVVEEGDTAHLLFVQYVGAMGWLVCRQIPMALVTDPVQSAFHHQALLTAFFCGLAILAAVLWLRHTLQPLQQLTATTRRLTGMDLSGAGSLDALERTAARGLDMKRQDEIGDLARAYAAMGRALHGNIQKLMQETASRERLAGEIVAAGQIQRDMLPDTAVLPGSVAAYLRPARGVGGDLYDVFPLADGRLLLAIGDVSDKGVPAALFMAMVITLVHSLAGSAHKETAGTVPLDPAAILTQTNALLEERNRGNMFVTLFLAIHNPATGALAYANAGHCPPLILRAADKRMDVLTQLSGPVAGVLPGLVYKTLHAKLHPGDCLLLYTDGVTEARRKDGSFFGMERLGNILVQEAGIPPKACVQAVVRAVDNFVNGAEQTDDITLLVLRQETAGSDEIGRQA